MKKSTIIWCLVAAGLMIAGAILAITAARLGASTLVIWVNGELKLAKEETSLEKTKVDPFYNMELDIQCSNVELIPSEDFYIEFDECIGSIDYEVKDDTLVVNQKGKSAFSFGFALGNEKENTVRIYYPQESAFGNVTLELDMGSINVESLTAEGLELECDMGSAQFDCCNVGEMDVKADMGDVEFETLSVDKFTVEANMGNVDISKLNLKEEGTVNCDMGNIEMSFQKPVETYQICAKIDMGTIFINDEDYGSKHRSEGEVPLKITGNMGDIELNFAQ